MTGALHDSSSAASSATDSDRDRGSALLSLASFTANVDLLAQAAAEPGLRRALLECAEASVSRPLCQSLLSDRAILTNLMRGSIVIQPFSLSNLSTSSYDCTLGPNYYREAAPEPGCALYNPYCAAMVARVWGESRVAERHSVYIARTGQPPLQGIAADDLLIWIAPGETILAHTNEYIGGTGSVTTMMKARSSMGRNFIEVCKCAGWGDIGYTNRWTMEVTNNSRYYSIPLVDGVVAAGSTSYERAGKYQTNSSMDVIKQNWQPSDMLPKMYCDRECVASQAAAASVSNSAAGKARQEEAKEQHAAHDESR